MTMTTSCKKRKREAGPCDRYEELGLSLLITGGLLEFFDRDCIRRLCLTSRTIRNKYKAFGNKLWREKLQVELRVHPTFLPAVSERQPTDFFFNQYMMFLRPVEISVGKNNSALLLDNGVVIVWGDGKYNQTTDAARDAKPSGRQYVAISCGDDHAIGLLDDGTAVGWGKNNFGQASGAAAALPRGRRYIAVCAGNLCSAGLLDDGTVVFWGLYRKYRTNLAAKILPIGRRYVAINIGKYFSVGLLDDGTAVQYDDFENAFIMTPPRDRRYVAISANLDHWLGLLDNGTVVGHGDDKFGRASGGAAALPNGRYYIAISAGETHSAGLLDNGTVVVWGDTQNIPMPDDAKPLSYGRRYVAISAGSSSTIGLFDDCTVTGWGTNYDKAKGALEALVVGRRTVSIHANQIQFSKCMRPVDILQAAYRRQKALPESQGVAVE